MKERGPLLVLTIAVCIAAVGCCTPKMAQSLSVTMHPQETGMWCWAASGQMVMDFLGHDVAQCTQANDRFGLTTCCNTPVPPNCVDGGWADYPRYGFTAQHTTDAPLSWSALKGEISTGSNCGNRPVTFTWHWDGGGGHTMVAIGYMSLSLMTGEYHFVEVNDPWPPNVGAHRWIMYGAYVSGTGYTHWDDYYSIQYVGD